MDKDIVRAYVKETVRNHITENTPIENIILEMYEDPLSLYMYSYSSHVWINDEEWDIIMFITYIATVVLKIKKTLRVMEQVLFVEEEKLGSYSGLVCRVINIGQFEFITFDFKEYIMHKNKMTDNQFKQRCIDICSKYYGLTTTALLLEEFKSDNEEDIKL